MPIIPSMLACSTRSNCGMPSVDTDPELPLLEEHALALPALNAPPQHHPLDGYELALRFDRRT
jgi:hypothetical protein